MDLPVNISANVRFIYHMPVLDAIALLRVAVAYKERLRYTNRGGNGPRELAQGRATQEAPNLWDVADGSYEFVLGALSDVVRNTVGEGIDPRKLNLLQLEVKVPGIHHRYPLRSLSRIRQRKEFHYKIVLIE